MKSNSVKQWSVQLTEFQPRALNKIQSTYVSPTSQVRAENGAIGYCRSENSSESKNQKYKQISGARLWT
jgi:hypothetical protein